MDASSAIFEKKKRIIQLFLELALMPVLERRSVIIVPDGVRDYSLNAL